MMAYGGVDVKIHIFLMSALAGGEWSASCPGHFTPRDTAPGTHQIGGWVDPIAGLDDMEKFLDPTSTRTRPLGHPACSHVFIFQQPVQLYSPRYKITYIKKIFDCFNFFISFTYFYANLYSFGCVIDNFSFWRTSLCYYIAAMAEHLLLVFEE
jgi:hypothetical protein